MGNISEITGQAFDPSTVEKDSYEPLPPGWHVVVIETAEVRQTKAKDGHYVYLETTVCEGEHEGRKVFLRFNIANPNPTATRIGQQQLAAVCEATGAGIIEDTCQLIGKCFTLKIKVKNDQADYAGAKPATIGGLNAPVAPGDYIPPVAQRAASVAPIATPRPPAYAPSGVGLAQRSQPYTPAATPAASVSERSEQTPASPQGTQPPPATARKMPWQR
jgi:hypothetical protein